MAHLTQNSSTSTEALYNSRQLYDSILTARPSFDSRQSIFGMWEKTTGFTMILNDAQQIQHLMHNNTGSNHHVNRFVSRQMLLLYSLEMQVLESEVRFHNTSSFDPGPQNILLGGHIRTMWYPVQVIQIACWKRKHNKKVQREVKSPIQKKRDGCRWICDKRRYSLKNKPPLSPGCVSMRPTHYAAESLSWYSRERLKQARTPPSFHSRWMTPASSPVMKPSSAEPANTNSCRASS